MLQTVDGAVAALREALGRLGHRVSTGVVTEHWEGTYVPEVMAIVAVGLGGQEGPAAEITVYALGDQVVELAIEVTLPAQLVTVPPAELWERAKDIVGIEVGISGLQRYFRSQTARAVHISLDAKYVIDYWFEIEVPGEDDDEEAWTAFEGAVMGVAGGIVGLLRLADEAAASG